MQDQLPEISGWRGIWIPGLLFAWAGVIASGSRWLNQKPLLVRVFVFDVLLSQLAGFGAFFVVNHWLDIWVAVSVGMAFAHMGPRGVHVLEDWALSYFDSKEDQK